jgi:BirA family transcriptional regulator, biotin operon repressor / biotin---[acetyl-CoA-carboxylase] ligase
MLVPMHASCIMLLLTAMASRRGGARHATKLMSSLTFHELDSVESTQDEARQLLSKSSTPYLAVSAKQQHKGRGTSGRVWKGLTGNVFLTVALPFERVSVSVTLLPLQVGIIIAETLQKVLKDAGNQDYKLILKWPNDVLINRKKVAGVLIESHIAREQTFLLVGVGINIFEKPEIPSQEGRPAASIQEYCSEQLPDMTPHLIATDIANRLVEWMEGSSGHDVVETWKLWAEFNTKQTLRDTGEVVVPVNIERDGQLLVRQENGEQRLLIADYLY